MMKNVVKLIICITLVGGIAILNSCKKSTIKGCMDPDSRNYNSKADEDDGSCAYDGSIVFWYNQATSDSLVANGSVSLTYYVDGVVVGSSATSVYWTGAPNCGQSGSVTINKDLGSNKSRTASYSVKDESGLEYWSGTLTFTANTCQATELTY
jgi:hypothetical protein